MAETTDNPRSKIRNPKSKILAVALGALVPLVVLGAIWAAATSKLDQTYYPDATGIAGELLDGHSVGQTFLAQHDGLAAVDLQLATYNHVLTGDVVLHLRTDVTHTLDLATVRVPAASLANNAWQRFAFPPIAGSRGQQYYVELEQPGATPSHAITAYWALNRGDPYPYGRATQDRAPLDGDLTFGLHYAPPPGALWADLAQTLAAQVPRSMLVLLAGALLAAPLLLGLLLWGAGHGWFAGRGRVLLGGLLAAFALAHGAIYMVVVPPWQGPDEFAHYAYSVLLTTGVSVSDDSPAAQATRARIENSILAAMDARGFTHTVTWFPLPGAPASRFVSQAVYQGSTMYAETRQPPLYYRLAALPLRLYAADPTAIPPDIGLYLVRAGSVLWATLAVLLAWGCALLLAPGPGFRRLWLALPLTVALLPMRVFIDSMANNDVLAELATTLVVLLVCAWLTRPQPLAWRGLLLGALGLGLVGLSLTTKTSTTVSAAPALWLAGAIGAVGLQAWRGGRGARGTVLAGAGLLGVLVGLALLTCFDTSSTTQAWYLDLGQHATRAVVADAHDGTAVLALAPGQVANEKVELDPGHPALNLTFQVWARPAPGAGPGALTINLSSDYVPISATAGTLTWPAAAATWQPITATATVLPEAQFVRLLLHADTPVQIDDASLLGPAGALRILNAGMEAPGVQLRADSPLGQAIRLLPEQVQADLIVDTLANAQFFDKGTVVGSYLTEEYHSFWGWFGWLVIELRLPDEQYLLWGALIGLALIGVLLGWLVPPRWPAHWRAFSLVTLVALVTAIGTGAARQMMLLAQSDLRDFPQGRYLFVLIVPAIWLLLAGLDQLEMLIADCGIWIRRRLGRSAGPTGQPGIRNPRSAFRNWAGWLGLNLLLYLDLYALLVLIVPFYYGRF